MKVIVIDHTGVVTRFEETIRDWSTLDYEYVCDKISDYISNDCVVTIYRENFDENC